MKAGPPVLLVLLLLAAGVSAPSADDGVRPSLPPLDLAADGLSVSGVSSGAFMAHQVHLAHSTDVAGVGMVAGGPYACAEGRYGLSFLDVTGLYVPTSVCSHINPLLPFQGPPDPAVSVRIAREEAARGRIDPLSGLEGDRVWLLSGTRDSAVPTAVMATVEAVYETFVDPAAIRLRIVEDAEHAMITEDFGNPCPEYRSPFINDCDLDAAGEMLAHIYGPLKPRSAEADVGPVLAFDQRPYIGSDDPRISMADVGHLYLPEACAAGERCRLHVALHGCEQQAEQVGDAFYAHAGYNEWAESNRIVVLYPQTTAWRRGLLSLFGNPKACWDWWGYSGPDYATRDAPQIRAIARMVDALSGRPRMAPAP